MNFLLIVLGCMLLAIELGTSVGVGMYLVAIALQNEIEGIK